MMGHEVVEYVGLNRLFQSNAHVLRACGDVCTISWEVEAAVLCCLGVRFNKLASPSMRPRWQAFLAISQQHILSFGASSGPDSPCA